MFSIVSIKNCNHKSLGIYYLYSSLLFGISGTLCSMILRLELYSSGHRIISSENQNFYNFIFTLHGLLMIFLTRTEIISFWNIRFLDYKNQRYHEILGYQG